MINDLLFCFHFSFLKKERCIRDKFPCKHSIANESKSFSPVFWKTEGKSGAKKPLFWPKSSEEREKSGVLAETRPIPEKIFSV